MPVNPSGGLLAKGHPIGATGCAQLVELADQLRGRCGARQVDGARVALAENGGGFLGTDPAAMVVTILSEVIEQTHCGEEPMEFKQVIGNRRSIRYFEPRQAGRAGEDPGHAGGGEPGVAVGQHRLRKAWSSTATSSTPRSSRRSKTPTTTADLDLAPVHIFWYFDSNYTEGAQQRLKELVEHGA